jgi:hypothetical protein
LESVLQKIYNELQKPSPWPSPVKGEGKLQYC